jgi:outer membrane protein OmpA-like peptidoglycan-associated protein
MKVTFNLFTTLSLLMISHFGAAQNESFESFSEYDFVPGDQILFFEDFSSDQIGDFPALWASNGSGEVKTISTAPGKWFHMNGEDAVYCYTKQIEFPINFIMEFDIIPDEEYEHGMILCLYYEDEDREINDDLYPGANGLYITMAANGWETKGYTRNSDDWLEGQGKKNTVEKQKINHVIIWVQNRRVRIYHKGAKVVDMATNLFAGNKFNRFMFTGWDRSSWPFIGNIKITTAAPDTRSKLLTDGKLISYGIYFDSGKDIVKPESYATIKEIAKVMNDNPDLRVRIVGHTDSDGDNALNLDLSKRRAENVKLFLGKEFNIEAGRIETDGKGETEPLVSNSTTENKAKNRRVEFIKL